MRWFEWHQKIQQPPPEARLAALVADWDACLRRVALVCWGSSRTPAEQVDALKRLLAEERGQRLPAPTPR